MAAQEAAADEPKGDDSERTLWIQMVAGDMAIVRTQLKAIEEQSTSRLAAIEEHLGRLNERISQLEERTVVTAPQPEPSSSNGAVDTVDATLMKAFERIVGAQNECTRADFQALRTIFDQAVAASRGDATIEAPRLFEVWLVRYRTMCERNRGINVSPRTMLLNLDLLAPEASEEART